MEDFYTMLCRSVPLHKEMIDMQFAAMDVHRKGALAHLEALVPDEGLPKEELEAFKVEGRKYIARVSKGEKEERDLLARMVAQELRGLVYTVGDGLYGDHEKKGDVVQGLSFPLTKGKDFLPAITDAIFFGVWPVANQKKFLKHAYDWYVCARALVPEHFRRDEWEFGVDPEGELTVRLTGKMKERPPRDPNFVKATVVRRRRPRPQIS